MRKERRTSSKRERNRQLVAEVTDLKGGLTALEERARSELGMVGNSETFYQVVTPSTPARTRTRDRHHRSRAVSALAQRAACGPIVPAAGRGERFALRRREQLPKQYAPLVGASVLEWSLRALLARSRVCRHRRGAALRRRALAGSFAPS